MEQQKYQVFNNNATKQTEIDKKDNDSSLYKQSSFTGEKTEIQHGEFNLDSQEYQQVFKVFDKENTGEITIQQVYDLINKFEESSAAQQFSNLNLDKTANPVVPNVIGQSNKSGPRGSTHGIGSKSYAQQSNSIYSNGTYKNDNQQSKGHNNSSTYHHSRTSQKQNTGNGYGQDNSKFSPSRKHAQVHNGGNIGSNAAGGNLMQLHPTQMTSNNSNNQHKYQDNNNRSPRRPTEKGHLNQGKDKASYKMNGNVATNDQQAKSHSDNSNEENSDNNDIGSGIIQKNSKLKNTCGGGNPGSANNLIQQQAGVGNSQQITSSSTPTVMEFPNGKESLKFDEFVDVIRDSCKEPQTAENYLVLAFSMFDRQKKGYISTGDLQEVFELLGESISDEEVNTMIKIAGIKSSDKINFKEFVDFFYKID